jgi:hypothetical protein
MYVTNGPVLGPAIQLTPAAQIVSAWSNPDGTLAPNAPTPAEDVALGWLSLESLTAGENVLGVPEPLPVSAGILGFGRLEIVSFQNDSLVLPAESEALYRYLTGKSPDHGWITIDGADAVHGMPISAAAEMLAALHGRVKFP